MTGSHTKGEAIWYYPYQESIPLGSSGERSKSNAELSQVHHVPFQVPNKSEPEKKSPETPVIYNVNKAVSSYKSNLPNPAIVIVGCSRYRDIMNSIRALLNLKDVSRYQVYVSLGCPGQLNRNVANTLT